MKMVGIHNVESTMKAGDDTSHAVYPLASKVFLIPPFGKLDASGSCWISNLPEKRSMTSPSSPNSMNPSCFSAVPSVNGWYIPSLIWDRRGKPLNTTIDGKPILQALFEEP